MREVTVRCYAIDYWTYLEYQEGRVCVSLVMVVKIRRLISTVVVALRCLRYAAKSCSHLAGYIREDVGQNVRGGGFKTLVCSCMHGFCCNKNFCV